MLDRDESALQSVQLSIEGRGLLDSRELVVCCIRDTERLAEVFAEHRPEVVFHAAALKHLPLLEMHPEEGWKTNVWGTRQPAGAVGPPRRGAVRQHLHGQGGRPGLGAGTDQAAGRAAHLPRRCAPTPGPTCRCASATCWAAGDRCCPLFRAQIEQGGPVTVTDTDVTRYFMTIPEACELVIQAGALGRQGRGPGAGHGRARPHRRPGPAADPGVEPAHRDRLHRASGRARSWTRSCSARTRSGARPATR